MCVCVCMCVCVSVGNIYGQHNTSSALLTIKAF